MIAWVVIDRRHFTQSGLCEGSRQASPFASAPYSFISFTSFVSHLPYSLPSSVSRNSFVWHSYETAGGCANNSQCGNSHCTRKELSARVCIQVLSFHILAHSFAPKKTQLLPFQAIPHSLLKNTGVGVPTFSSPRPRLIASKVE